MRNALASALVVSLAACGLGEKEQYADRVTAAPAVAIERGTVAGTITSSVELVKGPIDQMQGGGAFVLATDFVADLGAHRSRLETSQLVHDDLVIHLRRSDAKENDARPWLTLEVADLPESAGLPFMLREGFDLPFAVFTLPPTVLVDLIGGALTGSLDAIGTQDLDGTRVEGYSGRFDLDKMLNDTREDDYDKARSDGVAHAFDILDIPGRVHDGRVWLDGDGLPRRFEVTFDQKPRRRWTFEVTMTIDFLRWGEPVAFDLPTIEETIRIESLSRLVSEISRAFPQPEAATLPEVPTTTTTAVAQ